MQIKPTTANNSIPQIQQIINTKITKIQSNHRKATGKHKTSKQTTTNQQQNQAIKTNQLNHNKQINKPKQQATTKIKQPTNKQFDNTKPTTKSNNIPKQQQNSQKTMANNKPTKHSKQRILNTNNHDNHQTYKHLI